MFKIDPDTKHIYLTRGNSCKIDITPLCDCDSDAIILSDNDKVIFTMAAPSGRVYLQKILTSNDYDGLDDMSLNLILTPEDTINIKPLEYRYDVLLVYEDGASSTFISNAKFSLLQALGTYKDLGGAKDGIK